MISYIHVFKKPVGALGLLVALSAHAFADFTTLADIKSQAQGAIVSYLKDDPTCHSCRGNDRSAGVTYLEQVQDNSDQRIFLRGQVWSNSCQNGGQMYGSSNATLGQCGYTEVQFLLPIVQIDGEWIPIYDDLRKDTQDGTPVSKITPANLVPAPGNFLHLMAVPFVKADPSYPAMQIDIEEIFTRSAPYLN
jgi:hypothetical protein